MAATRAKLAEGTEAVQGQGQAARVPGPGAVQEREPLAAIVQVTGQVAEKHWPKKHAQGALKRGDSVWYRGERFWIERVPDKWADGCYARICDKPVHPDPTRPSPSSQSLQRNGLNVHGKKEQVRGELLSFCVHPDLLDLAPQAKSIYAAQPTAAGIARAERAAKGERDVGDDVAVRLRACKGLDDVYREGAEFLGVAEPELRAKYGHLNPGQQRMNIGNRMRAKWKKENAK